MITRFIARLRGGANALPPDLTEAIEAARVHLRTADPESGEIRLMVALAGRGIRSGFIFSREAAAEKIAARWPELNDSQKRRAVDFLQAHVDREKRRQELPSTRRERWVRNY